MEQREIWKRGRFSWINTDTTKPGWKYDGSEAIIQGLSLTGNTGPELISLTSDGQAKELTNLGKEGKKGYILSTPKWSPNGRYIAFSLTSTFVNNYWYVLDTQTGQVTDYCISPVNDFYWSPDSSQIAINLNWQSLVILDIES